MLGWEHHFGEDKAPTTKDPAARVIVFPQPEQEHNDKTMLTEEKRHGHAEDRHQ